jgi:hypothetical protein
VYGLTKYYHWRKFNACHQSMRVVWDKIETLINLPKSIAYTRCCRWRRTNAFDPTSHHAIIHYNLTIPVKMSGVVSYFETQTPKPWDIDSLKQIVLTSNTYWESFSETVPSSEVRNSIYVSSFFTQVSYGRLVPSTYRRTLIPELLDDNELSERVLACVHESSTFNDTPIEYINYTPSNDGAIDSDDSTTKRNPWLNAIELSKRWGISIQTAAATLDASTQTAFKNIFSPSERKVRKRRPWLESPSIK